MAHNGLSRRQVLVVATLALTTSAGLAADGKSGPGFSATEIRIGNTYPYSGPASAYGVIGQTEAAYFQMVNDNGGINGRKIAFISYDDAYSPAKTIDQTRKLVESDDVLLTFNTFGSPGNAVIQRYMNSRKIPQLFGATGASKFNDPTNFPWTMGYQPSTRDEANVYVSFLRQERPAAKIAILYQNDDFGKDYLGGVKDALGTDYSKMVISEEPYDILDPTIDSQILRMKASGADTVLSFSTPKFAAQTIRKLAAMNWKPMHIVASASSSAAAVMRPAGIENAQGAISALWIMSPDDPTWKDHPDMQAWRAFMEKYAPRADLQNAGHIYAYVVSQTIHRILQDAGDDLSRENVMKLAASMKGLHVKGLLPGITLNTTPSDYAPVKQMQLVRFKDNGWERFGELLGRK
jgi:branched-chain amino acid transport system substrate-binding protein